MLWLYLWFRCRRKNANRPHLRTIPMMWSVHYPVEGSAQNLNQKYMQKFSFYPRKILIFLYYHTMNLGSACLGSLWVQSVFVSICLGRGKWSLLLWVASRGRKVVLHYSGRTDLWLKNGIGKHDVITSYVWAGNPANLRKLSYALRDRLSTASFRIAEQEKAQGNYIYSIGRAIRLSRSFNR